MECYCDLRKNQDLLSDGKTPYERRIGTPFNGPVIPFGEMVGYHSPLLKTHLDYISLGDIMVADIEDLEEMDASEIYSKKDSMSQRKNSVLTPLERGVENFIFP